MDGFWRWPRLEVVCLGSWPMACIRGSVSRNASITTLPVSGGGGVEEGRGGEGGGGRVYGHYSIHVHVIVHAHIFNDRHIHTHTLTLTFNALYGIHYHGNSSSREGLKALLGVDVDSREPAPKPRVGMVPGHTECTSNEPQLATT